MIRFLLVFGLLFGISEWEPFVTSIREPYCEILAHSLALAFSLTSLDPVYSGSTISVSFGSGLTVIPSCDGLILLTLFIAGVAAMPIQRTLRPYAWAGGYIALLIIINWFRLAMLALTGFYQPDLFKVLHIYVLQGVLIFAVVILFLAWLSQVEPKRTGVEAAETNAT